MVSDPIKDPAELRRYFSNPKNEHRPVTFFPLDGDITDSEFINTRLTGYKKAGFGGVALQPTSATLPVYGSDEYYGALCALLDKIKKAGLFAALCDDTDLDERHPSGRGGGKFVAQNPQYRAHLLKMYEYKCSEYERVNRPVRTPGVLMSVCAYEVDTAQTLDLRPFLISDRIIWDVPDGNWNLLQFICEEEPDPDCVDYLSYDASAAFLQFTFERLLERDESGALSMTISQGIAYQTANRRQWSPDFNEIFLKEFGVQAEPFYPALFFDTGAESARAAALLINCRAKLLADGFFRALSDFARSRGLIATGCVAEPKATAAPWLFGDGMLYQKYSDAPGTSLSYAYAYGTNGIKLASSAADCWGGALVACDIFREYYLMGKTILYSEAMNAMARGVNLLMARDHIFGAVKLGELLPAWCDFAARAQAMLRGGVHLSDIALLYPIHSLQSQVKLYDSRLDTDFEYPTTPSNADYMNIINALLNYCGRDLTVIHPEVFANYCTAENSDDGDCAYENRVDDGGVLYLRGDMRFNVLILPGASMIDLRCMRIARDFFDRGGKLVATDDLPFTAFTAPGKGEDADRELSEIINHIFGVTKSDIGSFTQVYTNKNRAGGEAYFIQLSQTAADGTDLIAAPQLDAVLGKLDVDWDVVIEDMPRVENSGILSVFYPTFEALRANRGIRSGGMFNYIHKRRAGCDIWYFSNTTTADYEGAVKLRGLHALEEWNPHTGKIRRLASDSAGMHTTAKLTLPSKTSVFWVSMGKFPL